MYDVEFSLAKFVIDLLAQESVFDPTKKSKKCKCDILGGRGGGGVGMSHIAVRQYKPFEGQPRSSSRFKLRALNKTA